MGTGRQLWVQDVTVGEDYRPIYRGYAAEIWACNRHMGLNMLKDDSSHKNERQTEAKNCTHEQ